jgi:transcription termination/antitermination protein NusG
MSRTQVNEPITTPLAVSRCGMPTTGCRTAVYEPEVCWYAVRTRSRHEKAGAEMLSNLNIQHYLPLTLELRQWSDRRQRIEVPLFSGYLFVRISMLNSTRLQVLKVPGIVAFVGNQGGPLPIPDIQIASVQTVLQAGVECSVDPLLKQGDRVRVTKGALAGIEGTLIRANSTDRLLISIEMIHQSLSINISKYDIEFAEGGRVLATI